MHSQFTCEAVKFEGAFPANFSPPSYIQYDTQGTRYAKTEDKAFLGVLQLHWFALLVWVTIWSYT